MNGFCLFIEWKMERKTDRHMYKQSRIDIFDIIYIQFLTSLTTFTVLCVVYIHHRRETFFI